MKPEHPFMVLILVLSCFAFSACCSSLAVTNADSVELDEKQQALAKKLNLPPDPGEAGKATLLGIDSDNDGVRDDIQRYIELTYPESARKRAALRQYAKAANDALEQADDKRASINNSYKMDRSQECSSFIWGSVIDFASESRKLHAKILNTQERTSTFFDFDDQLGGEVFSSSPIELWDRSCDFDPDSLPN